MRSCCESVCFFSSLDDETLGLQKKELERKRGVVDFRSLVANTHAGELMVQVP